MEAPHNSVEFKWICVVLDEIKVYCMDIQCELKRIKNPITFISAEDHVSLIIVEQLTTTQPPKEAVSTEIRTA